MDARTVEPPKPASGGQPIRTADDGSGRAAVTPAYMMHAYSLPLTN